MTTKPVNLPGDEKRQKIFASSQDLDTNETAEERNRRVIDKSAQLNGKLRELVKETICENFRKSNFIRVYPSRTSNIYDKYFAQTKPINLVLQKCLFTNEVIPFPNGYPLDKVDSMLSPSRPAKSENHNNLKLQTPVSRKPEYLIGGTDNEPQSFTQAKQGVEYSRKSRSINKVANNNVSLSE